MTNFHSNLSLLSFILDITSKLTESLEQITTSDVEKLLSKSSVLSENLLLQLRQSLTKEWGTGSVGIPSQRFHSETPNRGIVCLELIASIHYLCSYAMFQSSLYAQNSYIPLVSF